jgi:hypothetical protein
VSDLLGVSELYKHEVFSFITGDSFELKLWQFDFSKGVLELMKRLPVECK